MDLCGTIMARCEFFRANHRIYTRAAFVVTYGFYRHGTMFDYRLDTKTAQAIHLVRYAYMCTGGTIFAFILQLQLSPKAFLYLLFSGIVRTEQQARSCWWIE
jgi:hypothetical protein